VGLQGGGKMKLVILEIGNDGVNEGFTVTLRISEDDLAVKLPPAPELGTTYENWQNIYIRQEDIIRWCRIQCCVVTIVSKTEDCRKAANLFLNNFNQWLDSPEFWQLRERIAGNVRKDEPIRFVIKTQDQLLRRLPWHEWNLLETYRKGEIILHGGESKSKQFRRGKMRVLAAFGSSEGLDLEEDRNILQKSLPDADIVYLPQKDEILTRKNLFYSLYDKRGWDIFFFAGHSASEENGKIGRLYLTSDESITIDDLKNALQKSLDNGLQLAIFNSCDGLGLAHQLAALEIPNVVVMREPLPDKVAHEFLQNLLENLKDGEDLNLAVRHAREKLQSIEKENPCATWLPVICQHSKAKEFKYRQLPKIIQTIQLKLTKKRWIFTILLAISTLVFLIESDRHSSFSQRFSQGDKILFVDGININKKHGINAFSFGNWTEAIEEFKQSLKQNPDDPETRIYLNNAIIGDKKAVKIAVVVPAGSNPYIAKEILRGIAQKQEEINNRGGVKGEQLKIEIVNDDNDEEVAKQVAEGLVKEEEIIAVIGHNSANTSIEAASTYKGKLVMITPTSTANALTSDNQDKYIYRTVLTSQVLGEYLGNYAKENYQKIFICQDSRAKDQSFVNEFKDTVKKDKIDSIDCDFAKNETPETIVRQAKGKNVDAIFISPYVNNIPQALNLAKAIDKSKIKLLGNVTLNSSITLGRGLDAEGMVTVAPWDASNPNSKDFLQQSKQLWQTTATITWRSATSYDALGVITEAIERGNDTRNGIQKALANNDFSFQGITGKITFSSSGDIIGEDAAKPILQQLQCQDYHCSFETIDKYFNRHSLGEKILFDKLNNPIKKQAIESFSEGKYVEAIQQFNAYLIKNPNDPEARVYLNNAKAILAKGKLRLAVALPIGSNPEVAAEMLRGVGQVQEEIVSQGGINGKLLELEIFNDENKEEIAHKLAQEIVKDPTILAVIGHNASNASIAASKIYDANGLVMLTPTSFADALDNSSNGNIFRMTPNIVFFADRLADYILQTSPQAKTVICYDSDAPDNIPFKNYFKDRLQANYINLDCQLNAQDFNFNQKIKKIIDSGADNILLTPYVDRLDLAIKLAIANRGRLKLLGTPTFYLNQTLEKDKEALKGLTLSVPWFPDTSFDRAFPEKAKQLWKISVGWRTANSYDTTWTIVTALKQHPQRQGLNQILGNRNFHYTGVTGKIEFTGGGERKAIPNSTAIIRVVPDSKSPSGLSFQKVTYPN
jgi:branched-chain amino acid transport system substrate-binding protein